MSWLSGGVLFAVGALLWAAYLLPALVRRRQQAATGLESEQLERALVSLAETGELPDEPLNPRDHIRSAKQLDKAERKVERENLRALHEAELRRKHEARAARLDEKHSAEHRRAELIRLRTAAAWILLLSLVTFVAGLAAMFFGVTWMVAGGAVLAGIFAVVTLREVVRRLTALAPAVAAPVRAASAPDVAVAAPSAPLSNRGWQPRQLPSPLHLAEGSAAAATIASSEALEALRRRAREIAAEAVEATPPSIVAARARATAMAAHPSSYGQRMRARLNADTQVRQSAAAVAPQSASLTAAERVAARVVASESLVEVAEASLNVAEVLQRRRVS